MPQKVVFIINPASNGARTGKKLSCFKKEISSEFPNADIAITTCVGDATQIARRNISEGADLLVAVGGDGTANEVINGFFDDSGNLLSESAVFGLIERGTGGDLRKSFGWREQFHDNLIRLKRQQTLKIDIGLASATMKNGKVKKRYFVNVASFGLSGLVVELMNQPGRKLGGKLGYYWATIKAILAHKPSDIDLEVDGEKRVCRRNSIVALANGQFFGGGMQIAPSAKMDDGQLEQVSISDMGLWFFLRYGHRVYSGKHVEMPQVETYGVKKVAANAKGKVFIELDGEQFGMLPATFQVVPNALNIVI